MGTLDLLSWSVIPRSTVHEGLALSSIFPLLDNLVKPL
jgi:hypothetical protein